MRLTLSTGNLSGLAARFQARSAVVQRNVRRIVRRTGEAAFSTAFADAPKKTTFMANHLRLRFSANGLRYDVGFLELDFTGAGFAFYPLFVIFGTRYQQPNDFLFPANKEATREFRPQLRAALSEGWAHGRSV